MLACLKFKVLNFKGKANINCSWKCSHLLAKQTEIAIIDLKNIMWAILILNLGVVGVVC